MALSPLSGLDPPVVTSPSILKPTPLSSSIDILMDIGAARRPKPLPLWECYWYRDMNHLVKNYPHCLDIRQLSSEQHKELMEDLLAMHNIQEVKAQEVRKDKDFVECNWWQMYPGC